MKRTIASVLLSGAIALGGIGNLSLNDGEEPLSTYQIGGQNGVVILHDRNTINPGSSRYDLEMADRRRAEVRRNREVLARETNRNNLDVQPGDSYTGSGKNIEIIGYSNENCVAYSKRVTGISRSIGDGGRRGIQGTEPRVGAIGVEKIRTHAVVIEEINGQEITVTEANYLRGRITRRILRLSELMGFIYF